MVTLTLDKARVVTLPLDFQRMFLGDEEPVFFLELAVRTTIIFVYTLVLLRMLGKRGVAQLSLFEITIIIGLGSAVGDPMFQADVPLLHAMVVIGVVVILYRLFMTLLRRSDSFERFVEGTPSCLVTNGRIDIEALEKERLSQEELFEILRLAGISQLGEVKRAYLEQSGELSTFSFPPKEVFAGLPIVPPWDITDRTLFIAEKEPARPGGYACLCCGETTRLDVPTSLPHCPRCKKGKWIEATQLPLGEAVNTGS
jgi:uncharacterized membrane protein YcaP (DUF421 family)